jgi:hypothetical protein
MITEMQVNHLLQTRIMELFRTVHSAAVSESLKVFGVFKHITTARLVQNEKRMGYHELLKSAIFSSIVFCTDRQPPTVTLVIIFSAAVHFPGQNVQMLYNRHR